MKTNQKNVNEFKYHIQLNLLIKLYKTKKKKSIVLQVSFLKSVLSQFSQVSSDLISVAQLRRMIS